MSAVPTAAQIRQQFLDFFKEKQHTIVPSDNVGYTSRDGARIFTNAGMNQFVPIFLGERPADVDTWPGVLSKGLPTRAAEELRRVLDDTAAFASEIFGLFTNREDREPSEPRPELSATQMRGFLYSPLGDELATRIQLLQPYHGLVESDVIVVNTQTGERTGAAGSWVICQRTTGQRLTRAMP